jgi:hypothetical protein
LPPERSNSSCPIWKITRIREVGDNLELSLIDDIGVEAEALAPEACLTWGWGTDQVPDELNVFQYAYAITCHKAQGSEFAMSSLSARRGRPPSPRWRGAGLILSCRAQLTASIM